MSLNLKLTKEQKNILDSRRINHRNGKSKSYSASELKKSVNAHLKRQGK